MLFCLQRLSFTDVLLCTVRTDVLFYFVRLYLVYRLVLLCLYLCVVTSRVRWWCVGQYVFLSGGMELNPLNVRGRNGTRNKYQKRGSRYCLEDREGKGAVSTPSDI